MFSLSGDKRDGCSRVLSQSQGLVGVFSHVDLDLSPWSPLFSLAESSWFILLLSFVFFVPFLQHCWLDLSQTGKSGLLSDGRQFPLEMQDSLI